MKTSDLGSLEAIALVMTIIIAHIVIYLPATIIADFGSASILNTLYITAIIFIFTLIVVKLFKNFNSFDILDIANYLGGSTLKKFLSLFFTGYLIIFAGLFIRDFAESLIIVYFHDFKVTAIILLFLIASFIINKFGFRQVIRCNFLILPTILISIIIVVMASIPNFTFQRVFPVLGYGVKETFLTGLTNISAFSNFLIIFYLIPLLKNKKNFSHISFISMALSSLLLISCVATLLLVTNFDATQTILSIYLATRRISLGIFLQRPDSLFIIFWILSMFAYLSIITALSNYVFNKSHDKNSISTPSLIIISVLIFIVSILPQNVAQLRFLETTLLKYLCIFFVFGINFIILILGNIKLKLNAKKEKKVPTI